LLRQSFAIPTTPMSRPPHFRGGFGVARQNIDFDEHQRLVVSPRRAMQMLDCGRTRLYELIDRGELDSYLDGRSRKITVESIHRYIERQLKQYGSKSAIPPRSGRGSPRKNDNTELVP
jgi:excisionase family DNA binding protein